MFRTKIDWVLEQLDKSVGIYKVDLLSTEEIDNSAAKGFAATSYKLVGGGKDVIAFRGTDFDLNPFGGLWEFVKDVFNGWLPSFNVLGDAFEFGGASTDFQPAYALDFYKLVTKQDANGRHPDGPVPGDIVLTGHFAMKTSAKGDNSTARARTNAEPLPSVMEERNFRT